MGADQVLKMEVVTADGKMRVVNEYEDIDLFWALRGISVFVGKTRYATVLTDYTVARAPSPGSCP